MEEVNDLERSERNGILINEVVYLVFFYIVKRKYSWKLSRQDKCERGKLRDYFKRDIDLVCQLQMIILLVVLVYMFLI